MATGEISNNVYSVGALHWDRRLFDQLIPLPDGTTYNAYFISGSERNALIDTVDPEKTEELFENLDRLGINKIDYVVSNHAEQDHSGSIPMILEKFSEAKVVTNAKCKGFEMDLLQIPEDRFVVVNDGDEISLGDKKLQFILTPWVHWPETMVTYLKEDKILFSCDFFGSHHASSRIFVERDSKIIEDAKRYYAEIMMPFRPNIKKNIEKIEKLNINVIAPSHGPIYKEPNVIIDAYKDWVSDNVKNEVVIPYVSMHGSTERMVHYFIDALMERNIVVKPFNLPKTDIGELAMAFVDAATIVIASPTVLVGPHPSAVYATYLANALRPKLKFASLIGSYGWGSRIVDIIKGMIRNLKVELIEPVLIKGYPKNEDLKALDKLADKILAKHSGINIIK